MLNDFIKTTEDRDTILNSIDILSDSLYKTNFDIRKNLTPSAYQFIQSQAKGRITQSFLISLKQNLQDLPVLSLTLAFPPDEKMIEKLSGWVKTNVTDETLLDFEINPEILGGALISFNGKYLDESLSKKMEEIFSNQKEELLKTLN
ncbi:hypothetical protein COY91_02465 [Candidatus Shapirobacteria bacterium CG_4_10_14_0_8_um_filter_39_15]|nr:MAG: hypothetical protein COY91_02465 [Candidatus Shapirobacteria bacterium CG_4_10_14_0_8_um_filter_39_15]PJE67983.1 MAG: hypothetical protein COU94_04290 [Candidatus Shapirobacteria bacterium CG10_big_fil_rev_8_21_14_0_10_38_8]